MRRASRCAAHWASPPPGADVASDAATSAAEESGSRAVESACLCVCACVCVSVCVCSLPRPRRVHSGHAWLCCVTFSHHFFLTEVRPPPAARRRLISSGAFSSFCCTVLRREATSTIMGRLHLNRPNQCTVQSGPFEPPSRSSRFHSSHDASIKNTIRKIACTAAARRLDSTGGGTAGLRFLLGRSR